MCVGGVACTHTNAHMCWTHTWESEGKGLDWVETLKLGFAGGAGWLDAAAGEEQGLGSSKGLELRVNLGWGKMKVGLGQWDSALC